MRLGALIVLLLATSISQAQTKKHFQHGLKCWGRTGKTAFVFALDSLPWTSVIADEFTTPSPRHIDDEHPLVIAAEFSGGVITFTAQALAIAPVIHGLITNTNVSGGGLGSVFGYTLLGMFKLTAIPYRSSMREVEQFKQACWRT